jgi:uncharacterized protein with beta-barrel porin domain
MKLFANTTNSKATVPRFVAGLCALFACLAPSVAHAADSELVIQDPKEAYLSYERVEFSFGGCSPSGSTRLELRSDNAKSDSVISSYPAPAINAAGYVRAAVLLPATISPGTYYLAFQCYAPSKALLTASAAIKVAAFVTDPKPQTALAAGVVTLNPALPVAVDTALAKTGIDAIVIAPILGALAAVGYINVRLARRRSNSAWSAVGTRIK